MPDSYEMCQDEIYDVSYDVSIYSKYDSILTLFGEISDARLGCALSGQSETFNGLPIVFREDGYINMTKAAKHFPGKRLGNFWTHDGVVEYMAHLSLAVGAHYSKSSKDGMSTGDVLRFWLDETGSIPVERLTKAQKADIKKALTSTQQGSRNGTFCHPKLAVFFARWLDVRFAVWCDLMIDNILRGNIQTTVVVPTQEAPFFLAYGKDHPHGGKLPGRPKGDRSQIFAVLQAQLADKHLKTADTAAKPKATHVSRNGINQ